MSAERCATLGAPNVVAVRSCPRHGPVHDAESTCSALVERMVAGELEIVRCALPLEARATELELDLRVAEPALRQRRLRLDAITGRFRRSKRVLVS